LQLEGSETGDRGSGAVKTTFIVGVLGLVLNAGPAQANNALSFLTRNARLGPEAQVGQVMAQHLTRCGVTQVSHTEPLLELRNAVARMSVHPSTEPALALARSQEMGSILEAHVYADRARYFHAFSRGARLDVSDLTLARNLTPAEGAEVGKLLRQEPAVNAALSEPLKSIFDRYRFHALPPAANGLTADPLTLALLEGYASGTDAALTLVRKAHYRAWTTSSGRVVVVLRD
jgi:hypothetical protein